MRPHDPARDLDQQDDGRDPQPEIGGLGHRGAPDELVQIEEGVGDGGHAEERQRDVQPARPGRGRF